MHLQLQDPLRNTSPQKWPCFETVLSYLFWQKQFGADPKIVGKTINIDGAPFTVIDVTEPRFHGLPIGLS
jgi:hypothetical protein